MVLKNYIFSKVSGVYQQYTSDFTESLFKSYLNKNIVSNQIAVHRDGNLIYYTFIYACSSHELYGHSIVTGEVCTDIQWLYKLFMMSFEASAQKGSLFCYDSQGKVRKQVNDFSLAGAEIDYFFRAFKDAVEIKSKWKSVQPIDFTVSKDNLITLSLSEVKSGKIVEAIEHYHNVIVTEFNIEPSSYAVTIKRLNDEKHDLLTKITTLEDKVSNLIKQKKQFGWVAILAFAVLALLIVLSALKNNFSDEISRRDIEVSELRNTISENLATISQARDSIGLLISDKVSMEKRIDNLLESLMNARDSLSESQEQVNYAMESLEDLQQQVRSFRIAQNDTERLKNEISQFELSLSKVSNALPIVINKIEMGNVYKDNSIETDYGNSIYSKNTMYLKPKIYYTGNFSGTMKLDVKLINPNGVLTTGSSSPKGYSYSYSISVSTGSNSATLQGWGNETKGNWSSGTYRIEIWYKDVCVKVHTFKIY